MRLQQFYHQISGNPAGNKLVFLHGLMGSLANWRRITPAFEDRFQILTFDQRGHGRSIQPTSGYQPSDFAQDLADILDELGWPEIYLVGHSMGGRNAVEFANLFPQRAIKLVVEDIGPGQGKDAMLVIERLIELVPTPFPNRQAAKDFFDQQYEGLIAFHPQPHVIRQFLFSNITERSDGHWDWRFYKPGILETLRIGHDRDRWDLVENLQMPTLWLRGEYSGDLSKSAFHEISRRNRQIQAVEIADSGHWIHFDQPDAFIGVVKDFLTLPV